MLLGWWGTENTKQRHLWPGISISRDSSDKSIDETLNQIMIARGMQPQSKGVVHWSISSVIKNPRLADTLLKSVYKKQALIPASPWLGNQKPETPLVSVATSDNMININWKHEKTETLTHFVVYFKYSDNWEYQIVNANTFNLVLPKIQYNKTDGKNLKEIIVTAVSRTGVESNKEIVKLY